jgi:hypothetical protein
LIWSGAAAGFFGHLGAEAWGGVVSDAWRNSAAGTIAFGAISGGIGAELTGGNFWQGAVTGGIVAGFNSVMHKMSDRMDLIARMKKGNIDPAGKPDFSQAGVEKMNNGVEGLSEDYKAAGSPKVSFDSTDEKEGGHTDSGHVHLNTSKITSNYRYASVLFHEYRHAWQWIYKWDEWSSNYEPNTAYNLMERDAYGYTITIGIYNPFDLSDSIIKENFDKFRNLTNHIPHF